MMRNIALMLVVVVCLDGYPRPRRSRPRLNTSRSANPLLNFTESVIPQAASTESTMPPVVAPGSTTPQGLSTSQVDPTRPPTAPTDPNVLASPQVTLKDSMNAPVTSTEPGTPQVDTTAPATLQSTSTELTTPPVTSTAIAPPQVAPTGPPTTAIQNVPLPPGIRQHCPDSMKRETDREWWRKTIIYELLPYSFKDSNGDGVGDLKGITSKLDHFVDLGIKALHLTPTYPTQFKDMGYDVIDYQDINPKFGTMVDFDELVFEMKQRNMKLILDFVLNHTSIKHEWFKKSVQRINPYTDFYVWKNAKGYEEGTRQPIPPNNWINVFDQQPGSAWKWNEQRGQFYLHQFLVEQADLNSRNEVVKDKLKKIIKFWLDKGVAGFRLDAVTCLMEDKYFRDNPPYSRFMQFGQEENFEIIHDLRTFLDEYNEEHGEIERIFIAEAHATPPHMRKYYDRDGYNITHFPYTFLLRDITTTITAAQLHSMIDSWITKLPPNAVSVWVTQDHDGSRVGSRIHPLYMDIFTIISMLLPGNVSVYYGQEIGMMDGSVEEDQVRDFSGRGSRDPSRLIMQWDNSNNAGFSNGARAFFPPNPDYFYRNVEFQKHAEVSQYNLFKNLSRIRNTDVFEKGDFESAVFSQYVYMFTRSYGNNLLIVISNLYYPTKVIDLSRLVSNLPGTTLSIAAASESLAHFYKDGMKIDEDHSKQFVLLAYSSVVLQVTTDS